jgi:hypothetical protein
LSAHTTATTVVTARTNASTSNPFMLCSYTRK